MLLNVNGFDLKRKAIFHFKIFLALHFKIFFSHFSPKKDCSYNSIPMAKTPSMDNAKC